MQIVLQNSRQTLIIALEYQIRLRLRHQLQSPHLQFRHPLRFRLVSIHSALHTQKLYLAISAPNLPLRMESQLINFICGIPFLVPTAPIVLPSFRQILTIALGHHQPLLPPLLQQAQRQRLHLQYHRQLKVGSLVPVINMQRL